MNTDVFDRELCELQEQPNLDDDPIPCTDPASSTVMSGDLKGSHVCPIHADVLREQDYQVIHELVEIDE